MNRTVKILTVVLATVVLCGCNPMSKLKMHGLVDYDFNVLGTPSATGYVDAENASGSNFKVLSTDLAVGDGKTTAFTATLDKPVVLPRHTRDTLAGKLDIDVQHIVPTIAIARTFRSHPEKVFVSGTVTVRWFGIKVKKRFENKPISEFLTTFGVKM